MENFDANVSANDAANEVVLIHHEDIDDDYTNNLTIRTFNVEKQASKGLFDSLKIILSSFNSDFESIMLEDIQSNEQVGSVLIRYGGSFMKWIFLLNSEPYNSWETAWQCESVQSGSLLIRLMKF
jgi:hypothetical protein